MTGLALLDPRVEQWKCENKSKKYNLCEVCFKPFNLANIDMHLEAGCAAEICNRYNLTPIEKSKKEKSTTKKFQRKCKIAKKPKKTTKDSNNKRKKKPSSQ